MQLLSWLEEWYKSQCNGWWEHLFGVEIGTIDNPGWRVTIDLEDTELENKKFDEYRLIIDEDEDWILCYIKEGRFEGAGDPSKLEEIIRRFKEWVEQPDSDDEASI